MTIYIYIYSCSCLMIYLTDKEGWKIGFVDLIVRGVDGACSVMLATGPTRGRVCIWRREKTESVFGAKHLEAIRQKLKQ